MQKIQQHRVKYDVQMEKEWGFKEKKENITEVIQKAIEVEPRDIET